MKTVVFCDFDGTVARRDVGYHLFHHFSNGKNDELIPDWKSGRISSRECLSIEADMVRATKEELEAYLEDHDLDPTFAAFAEECRRRDLELIILSDGLDFYIERLLRREGLGHIPWKSNKVVLEGDRMRVVFPHETDCPRCGNCKGERIREYRAAHGTCKVIFVGDGYSDACATDAADLIFAKKDLEQFCRKNNIEYRAYSDFNDVSSILKQVGVFTD